MVCFISNFTQFYNYFLFVSMLFQLNFVHGFLKTEIAATVYQHIGTAEEAPTVLRHSYQLRLIPNFPCYQ